MENTCIPVADSCRYMAKPIQYCKVKKKKTTLVPSGLGNQTWVTSLEPEQLRLPRLDAPGAEHDVHP